MTFDPPQPLASPAKGVSLWWCALDLDEAVDRATLVEWLSSAERARMLRFGNEMLRRRYLVGRASLRWVLAERIGGAPRDVAIVRGRRGRPELADRDGIDFNVSHTHDVALIGIAREGRIGVDVEREDRIIHSLGLARRILTERERAALPVYDLDAARRRILRLWTCKEALSKATGDAMSAPFRRIDIAIDPALALTGGPAPYLSADFVLHAAAVPAGYFGTVALWRPRNAGDESSADRPRNPPSSR